MVEDNKIKSYYIENTKFSRIALAQVYEIIIEYEDGIENVPESVIKFLDDNRDKEYVFDYGDDLENFKLEKDAENLLIYIYTKYLAPEEERRVIEDIAKMQAIQKEKEKQEQFSSDVFNSNSEIEEKIQENVLPVEYKESLIKKILRFFKNIFKRK
jgi:uncharacterized coiled-coil DUF342 family protein